MTPKRRFHNSVLISSASHPSSLGTPSFRSYASPCSPTPWLLPRAHARCSRIREFLFVPAPLGRNMFIPSKRSKSLPVYKPICFPFVLNAPPVNCSESCVFQSQPFLCSPPGFISWHHPQLWKTSKAAVCFCHFTLLLSPIWNPLSEDVFLVMCLS